MNLATKSSESNVALHYFVSREVHFLGQSALFQLINYSWFRKFESFLFSLYRRTKCTTANWLFSSWATL